MAARALAGQALSIFGDHQDVMACRSTGWRLGEDGSGWVPRGYSRSNAAPLGGILDFGGKKTGSDDQVVSFFFFSHWIWKDLDGFERIATATPVPALREVCHSRLSLGRCWRRRAWRWCSTTRWWRIWSPWNAVSPCSTSSMAFAPATRCVVFGTVDGRGS